MNRIIETTATYEVSRWTNSGTVCYQLKLPGQTRGFPICEVWIQEMFGSFGAQVSYASNSNVSPDDALAIGCILLRASQICREALAEGEGYIARIHEDDTAFHRAEWERRKAAEAAELAHELEPGDWMAGPALLRILATKGNAGIEGEFNVEIAGVESVVKAIRLRLVGAEQDTLAVYVPGDGERRWSAERIKS